MKSRIAAASLRAGSWAVHLLTAGGAVLALLAIDAVARSEWRAALVWLLLALAIDGLDGALSRRVQVAEHLPRIDGALLDLLVDYLNYVFVPAFLIWRSGRLPESLALPLCAAILVSSLYTFARRDMMTKDGFFRGFPALWNIVAIYFVLAPPAPWWCAAIVIILVVLTFAPVHVVHPFRATNGTVIAPIAALVWIVSTALLVGIDLPAVWWRLALGLSLAALVAIAAVGLVRTFRGESAAVDGS